MEEKKCNCNEPYDAELFQGGFPYCPIHEKPKEPNLAIIGHGLPNEEDDHLEFSIERGDLWKSRALSAERQLEELRKQPGAVWVKASERLPGWGEFVEWRHESKIPAGKDTLAGVTKRGTESLHSFEWYDESPAAAREEDVVEKLKASLDYYRGVIAGLGDSETDDFNRSVYDQHSGDLYTAIKTLERYEKYFNELFKQKQK